MNRAPENVCVLSLATENIRQYAEPIFKNNKKYCEKHGYDWVERWGLLDESRPPSWNKILAIQEQLEKGYDWVFWIDADALVMSDEVKIEEFLDERFDFVITGHVATLCCGLFFVQNTILAKQFLNQVYENGPVIETARYAESDGKESNTTYPWPFADSWEQSAFINNRIENSSRVKIIRADKGEKHFGSVPFAMCRHNNWHNGKSITSVGKFNEIFLEFAPDGHSDPDWYKIEYKEGDFILHFAGYSHLGKPILPDLKKFRPDLFVT